jgi:RNA polymerase sigma-70 factor (ECF subfamily)
MQPSEFRELLVKARAGDVNALGELIDKYRPYVRALAQRQLDSAVKPRLDPSDVVQQSCLEFHRDFEQFRGNEEGELLAWLKQILNSNVANAIRYHIFTKKRSTDRDQSMDDSGDGGQSLRQNIAGDQSSPSQKAIRRERDEQMIQLMDELSDDQREAVRLRHFEGWSLQQLAEHFDRSEAAVAGLLKRAMQKLRQHMGDMDSG